MNQHEKIFNSTLQYYQNELRKKGYDFYFFRPADTSEARRYSVTKKPCDFWFFDEAFAMAGEGECWVVPMRAGKTKKNLGTTFKKIRRSSVEPGPRIGQSLFRTYDPAGRPNWSRTIPRTWSANGWGTHPLSPTGTI